jgi:hypothetical protein
VIAVILTGLVMSCGGETTGTGGHGDIGDAAAGGSRSSSGSGGAGTSSGGRTGSGGAGLVACNDGTGNTDCCPPSALGGGVCDVNIRACSQGGCHGGWVSYLICAGNGTWVAQKGLLPCGAPDASLWPCNCTAVACAPGSHLVSAPGQCCPTCQLCGVIGQACANGGATCCSPLACCHLGSPSNPGSCCLAP